MTGLNKKCALLKIILNLMLWKLKRYRLLFYLYWNFDTYDYCEKNKICFIYNYFNEIAYYFNLHSFKLLYTFKNMFFVLIPHMKFLETIFYSSFCFIQRLHCTGFLKYWKQNKTRRWWCSIFKIVLFGVGTNGSFISQS